MFDSKGQEMVDEAAWGDIGCLRSSNRIAAVYSITKTLREIASLKFVEKLSLDLIGVLPGLMHGPFLSPNVPGSVQRSHTGDQHFLIVWNINFVHTDHVARPHIILFEHPDAKGWCNYYALENTVDKLAKPFAARYPEYGTNFPDQETSSTVPLVRIKELKILLFCRRNSYIGFYYKYALEAMYDDAIRCCKEKGIL
ncbi:hypothetical protein M9H77_17711 [Catharanthus roseus]|uniref:Uncharacterized protein n=1 Tax=Catharanthus roseus TaxID=4058 RepID=A0ACC0B5E5_CATRO|nr:hypothetical protein M9H77_17711 [Catharanthus roseus]